ncbi:MAG: hypothetical protein V2B18_02430 [Pseudomonadota bacterium]
MVWVVRKIKRSVWLEKEDLGRDAIGASAVTGDLRCKNNALSLWVCEDPSNSDELEKVVLALGSLYNSLEIMDLAWFSKEDIESAGVAVKKTPGGSHVQSVNDLHVDAVRLDLCRLNILAKKIAEAVRKKSHTERINEKRLLRILAAADGRLPLGLLKEDQTKLRKAIEEVLAKDNSDAP